MVMAESNLNQLLLVDDTELVADSEKRLRRGVVRVCKNWELIVNESMSKVMKCARMVDSKGRGMNAALKGKLLVEVVFQIFRVACCCGWRYGWRGEVKNE